MSLPDFKTGCLTGSWRNSGSLWPASCSGSADLRAHFDRKKDEAKINLTHGVGAESALKRSILLMWLYCSELGEASHPLSPLLSNSSSLKEEFQGGAGGDTAGSGVLSSVSSWRGDN